MQKLSDSWGECSAQVERALQTLALDHSSRVGFVGRRSMIPPLPLGEGRGEGGFRPDAARLDDSGHSSALVANRYASAVRRFGFWRLLRLGKGGWMGLP